MSGGAADAIGPLVVRRRLGAKLRALREDAGLRLDQAAAELEVSAAKISRLETGQAVAKTWDVRNLLTVYGVEDSAERDLILGWVESGKSSGWWLRYADTLPGNLDYYISLEAEAAEVSMYGVLIPALLQTPRYARAVVEGLLPDGDEVPTSELDALVQVRLERQAVLLRADRPLQLSVVIDEAALMRTVGGEGVLSEQLDALMSVPDSVQLRVRPLSAPFRRATLSSFVIFEPRLSNVDRPVVSVESSDREIFLEDPDDLDSYRRAFRLLCNESLSPADSLSRVRDHRQVLGRARQT